MTQNNTDNRLKTMITAALFAALACGIICRRIKKTPGTRYAAVILGGISDIVLVAGGYFLCEALMYGAAGAAASIPANLIQGTGGLVIACLLYPFVISVPWLRQTGAPLKNPN